MHECKVPSGLPGSHRRLTGLQPCSSHHSRTSFVVAHHGNPPSHAPKDMAGRVALLPGATCLCSKAECVCVKVCVCVCVCVQLWSVLSLLWLMPVWCCLLWLTCLCGVVYVQECAKSALPHMPVRLLLVPMHSTDSVSARLIVEAGTAQRISDDTESALGLATDSCS